jgi:hypothetical protein
MNMPTICGKCGGSLTECPVKDERWDPDPGVWVGFVDCPGCGQRYIFMRKGPPPVNGRNL